MYIYIYIYIYFLYTHTYSYIYTYTHIVIYMQQCISCYGPITILVAFALLNDLLQLKLRLTVFVVAL